jgi:hypothetical protein
MWQVAFGPNADRRDNILIVAGGEREGDAVILQRFCKLERGSWAETNIHQDHVRSLHRQFVPVLPAPLNTAPEPLPRPPARRRRHRSRGNGPSPHGNAIAA